MYIHKRLLCRKKLQTALKELAKDTEGHYFLAALRDIISTFVSYRATNTPPFVTHCLQGVSRPPCVSQDALQLNTAP